LRSREAFLITGNDVPDGFSWYLALPGVRSFVDSIKKPIVFIPDEFNYLNDGDVVRLAPKRGELQTLYRRSSFHNSFLLTERCNNYCLMCSQPPRNVDDEWLVDEILEAITLIDIETREIGFTGGEPTLLEGRFIELVQACKSYLPSTALHVLTNGRRFSDLSFSQALGDVKHHDLMLGIPIYSDIAHLHDYVVQADGAFDETIRGILNLKKYNVKVELRIVLHKLTVDRLPEIAEFIVRNLLFVDHVALMGLEIMGFTRANLDKLWVDPYEYRSQLREAALVLDRARMRVSIYNTPLCLMETEAWRFARRSISDWKQQYVTECESCSVRNECSGFFVSSGYRRSNYIRPIINQTLG